VLDLPLFDAHHRSLSGRLSGPALEPLASRAAEAEGDVVEAGREAVRLLAAAGLFDLLVPAAGLPDLRAVCLARESLAAASAFADSIFAVNGLGAYPLARFGTEAQRRRYLTGIRQGELVGAFALTEPGAGSDVNGIETVARPDGPDYVLEGVKTFISNAGLAAFYIVFAATPPTAPGGRTRLSAFLVEADRRGLTVANDVELLAPHPIGTLRFTDCRVPADSLVGPEGDGRKVAFATLDFFRPSVGAAACGLAARALDEARRHATQRRQFGSAIADFQATQLTLADMATELDAARLLVYRAAWMKDHGHERISREASIAKLFATEAAQRIVDRAVQVHGGIGVRKGAVVERLYREVRALRIYEGTSEIQRLIIARHLLADGAADAGRGVRVRF
jgi:acyl-CoA dehydrogenase